MSAATHHAQRAPRRSFEGSTRASSSSPSAAGGRRSPREALRATPGEIRYEADDKCAWSPAPFIDPCTGYAYQYEWSNANSGCVKTR